MNRKKFISVLAGVMAGIMLLTLLISLFSGTASAASSSAIKDQITELENEKAQIDAQLKELKKKQQQNLADIAAIKSEKDNLDQQIGLLQQQMVATTQLISAYNLLIADKQEEVDAAEKKLETLNAAYKERIRAMEEEGNISYWAVIFEANSFFDLLDRLNMIEEIAASDKKRLQNLNDAATQLQQAKDTLASERTQLQETKKTMEALQAELEQTRQESSKVLAALMEKNEEYESWIEASEKLQSDMMNQLAKKEDEYDKAKYSEWLATSVPPTSKPGSNTDKNGITWYLPLPSGSYYISSPFGYRTHPITGKPQSFHQGIDMAAVTGTKIYATRAGVVTVASYQEGGAGYYVKINHGDGYISIYMHMTHYIVKVGDFVEAGQVIGYVGSTGGSTGPHLHFGIAYDGDYKNPLNYING